MNLKTLRVIFCGAAGGLCLGAPALATAESAVDSGWFVEAGIVTAESSRDVGGFAIDGDETGWQLGFGYTFSRIFSLQATYHDLGRDHFATTCPPPLICVTQNVDSVDIDGYSLSTTLRWPITRIVDLYAKLGVANWHTDFGQFQNDRSDTGLLFGAGLGVNVARDWRLGVEYDRHDVVVDAVGVSVTWQFK